MENNKTFDFQLFVAESKEALLNPQEYFAKVKLDGGYIEPIIKALIYGAIGGFISQLWLLFHLNVAIGGLFGSSVGFSIGGAILGIFWGAVFGVIGAFIGGVIILIISSICNGNNDYEANFRIVVALMVIYPISAFVAVFSALALWIGTLASLAVSLYSLYMLYFAITLALKGKEQTARTIGYVLAAILAFFMLIGLLLGFGARTVSNYGVSRYEKELNKLEKMAKEFEKSADSYEKDLEKMLEDLESDDDEEVKSDASEVKPERFPSKAAERGTDWFYKGNSVLSETIIDKVVEVTDELKGIDQTKADFVQSIFSKYGYSNADDYGKDFMAIVSSFTALQGLVGLEEIMNSPEAEKKAAEAYGLDQVMINMVKQSVDNSKLTINDIKLAYDNWDELSKLIGQSK
jgi:hypothetical protein